MDPQHWMRVVISLYRWFIWHSTRPCLPVSIYLFYRAKIIDFPIVLVVCTGNVGWTYSTAGNLALLVKTNFLVGRTKIKGRDKERSPLFLVLQTPSKSFRHCSLPRVMWVVLWEVKSMTWIFMSSFGGNQFLHICKFEWFKSKRIWIDENAFICSQEPCRALNSVKRPSNTILWGFFTDRTLASTEYNYFIFWGKGGRTGVSDFVTSLA